MMALSICLSVGPHKSFPGFFRIASCYSPEFQCMPYNYPFKDTECILILRGYLDFVWELWPFYCQMDFWALDIQFVSSQTVFQIFFPLFMWFMLFSYKWPLVLFLFTLQCNSAFVCMYTCQSQMSSKVTRYALNFLC